MSYQNSPSDSNRYIKALIEAAEKGEDLRNINDQFGIPIKNAADYIKRVAYLLSANGSDIQKVADVLNLDVEFMDQIDNEELRKFVRNQNNFNQVLELRDLVYDEPVEKHNTEDDQRIDDSDNMANNQPPVSHDNDDSHNVYNPNKRVFNQPTQREKEHFVKRTRDDLLKESASADQFQIPQFKNRKELLKWILDRVSYLQKTKVDDFMSFFVSDEEYFMNNPDQLYILMFNHLGKHAADIAYERFKRLLGNLSPDQGFFDGGYNMNMGMPGMMGGMGMYPGMMQPQQPMPGMGPGMHGMTPPSVANGQKNTGANSFTNQFQQTAYTSNPQQYYVWKGVLPPFIPYNSEEGQTLIWEYEKKEAEKREREERRAKWKEDLQDQMEYKMSQFFDSDKLAAMNGMGGGNGSNAQNNFNQMQNQMSQMLIAQGTHVPSYINNPDGTTSMIAVPKQNGQNNEMSSITNIYGQLIQTMKTINDTVIANLTKPNEYKDRITEAAFNNLLSHMDPLASVEKMKDLMNAFQPPFQQQGNNIRDVIDTANYMLQAKKLDYDAKFVEKQQEREDKRWMWEREQEQKAEQDSKSQTMNLIKTFTEVLPNAIGPIVQIYTLMKGGNAAAGGGGGGLGNIGGLLGSLGGLGGMLGGGGGNQQGDQQINMNDIMGQAQEMLGQIGLGGMMGGGATPGGQMGPQMSPFGSNGGTQQMGMNPGTMSSPNPGQTSPDMSNFSPYFRQNIAPKMSFEDQQRQKFQAPPSDTWANDFAANVPEWNPYTQPQVIPEQEPQPQQEQFYQQYEQTGPGANERIVTISQNEPAVPEPKGPLEFTEEEFANLGEDELENYKAEIQNTQISLTNAMNTISNTLTRKKRSTNIPKTAFGVQQQAPKTITINETETTDINQDGQPESIENTTLSVGETGPTTETDRTAETTNGNENSSILGDIKQRATDADSIF